MTEVSSLGFVPAAANHTVVIVHADRPYSERHLRPIKITWRVCQVLAWEIVEDGTGRMATPVLNDSLNEDETLLFPEPDGRFIDPDGAEYRNEEHAREGILLLAQKRWDFLDEEQP